MSARFRRARWGVHKAAPKPITTHRTAGGAYQIVGDSGVLDRFHSQYRMHMAIHYTYNQHYKLVNRTQPEGAELMRKHKLEHYA